MINPELTADIAKRAVLEDMPWSDITTDILFNSYVDAKAKIIAREKITVSGTDIAVAVFESFGRQLNIKVLIPDGSKAERGDTIIEITGDLRFILKGERVSLNFLQRLSGIATLTSRYISMVDGYNVLITDTRKTTPTLRFFEKKAVADGGGRNHRYCLSDSVLIKDTHLSCFPGIGQAVKKAKTKVSHTTKVEVEISRLEHLEEAISAGADIVMFDNMTPEEIKKGVTMAAGRVITEASGNINLENVRRYAVTGVNAISIGALTHSAPAVDIHMKTERLLGRS